MTPARPHRAGRAPSRGGAGEPFAILLALCLALWLPAMARAHSQLLSSAPAEGAVLDTAPDRITLRFGEPVRPIIARLTRPDDTTGVLPDPVFADGLVTWTLPDATAQGSYLLSWRVTSADGHPLAGGLLFSVGHPSGISTGAEGAPPATRAGLWLARAVLLSGLILGAGGAGFTLISGRAAPRFSRLAAGAGLIALPVVVLFQGLELLGAGPASASDAAPWAEGLAGPPALALGLAALSLILALAARRPGPAALSLLTFAASAASSGHAATAAPQAMMRPAVALHVLAAGFWIGALAPLAALLREGRGDNALRRFSAAIPWALGLLIATGIALAMVQLGRIGALWSTDYGRVLTAKLALVAALLALALWNRLRLTPLAEAGRPAPLIRAIRVEILLGIAIVAVLALWRFTPPPRALGPPPTPVVQAISGDHASARVTVSANRPGPVTVILDDFRLDGAPFVPLETTVEFAKPAWGLGPFTRTLPKAEGPRVDAGTFLLPMEGFWVLTVTLLIDDFRSERIRDIVTLEPAR